MVLTILSLFIGYLTLSVSVALLYAAALGSPKPEQTIFIAFAAIGSLGFATISGYLTAIVAKRDPIFHTGLLAILFTTSWVVVIVFLPTFLPMTKPLSVAVSSLTAGVLGIMAGGWWRLQQTKTRGPL